MSNLYVISIIFTIVFSIALNAIIWLILARLLEKNLNRQMEEMSVQLKISRERLLDDLKNGRNYPPPQNEEQRPL
jgi:uncharacterized membrane protein